MKVDAYLGELEGSIEEMTDSDIKEFGSLVLGMAERCSNGRYGNILNSEKIAHVAVPNRESIRLLVTAFTAIIASAISLYLIDLLRLSPSLEPLAVSSSVLVSALVGYGKKATEKIGTIRGMLGQ